MTTVNETLNEHIQWVENLCGTLTIGNTIKAIRKKQLGITQSGLAKKLNISKKYLSDIENDKIIPNLELIAKAARVLGHSSDSFYNILKDQIKRSKKDKEFIISIKNTRQKNIFLKFISSYLDQSHVSSN